MGHQSIERWPWEVFFWLKQNESRAEWHAAIHASPCQLVVRPWQMFFLHPARAASNCFTNLFLTYFSLSCSNGSSSPRTKTRGFHPRSKKPSFLRCCCGLDSLQEHLLNKLYWSYGYCASRALQGSIYVKVRRTNFQSSTPAESAGSGRCPCRQRQILW